MTNATHGRINSLAAQIVRSHVDGSTRPPTDTSSRTGAPHKATTAVASSNLSVDEWMMVDEVGYEPCGLVFGVAIFHIGLIGVRSGNQEIETLSSALLSARELACQRLQKEAEQADAHGVVGVRLTISMLEGKSHLAQFTAVGTGIRPKKAGASNEAPPFLSSLSGQEFAVLAMGGYLPVGLVMGACVYHVGRLGIRSTTKTVFRSLEMTTYTSALYEARELAMNRLQKEAAALDAEGVVGVETSERSHVWGSHVIEFFAMGTAIRSVQDEIPPLDPGFALSVHDDVIQTDPSGILGRTETEQSGGRR